MTKVELVDGIASMLPSELGAQERQHLEFYPGKALLEAIHAALQSARTRDAGGAPPRARGAFGGTLADKARAVVQRLRPHLSGYPENKAVSELGNTTHGVLDKLWEGL